MSAHGCAAPAPRCWLEADSAVDGVVNMVWDRGPHHIEFGINRGCADDFFYRDRRTSQTASGVLNLDTESLLSVVTDAIAAWKGGWD